MSQGATVGARFHGFAHHLAGFMSNTFALNAAQLAVDTVYRATLETAWNGVQELWKNTQTGNSNTGGGTGGGNQPPQPRRSKPLDCERRWGLPPGRPNVLMADYNRTPNMANDLIGDRWVDTMRNTLLARYNGGANNRSLRVPLETQWRIEAGSSETAMSVRGNTAGNPRRYAQFITGMSRVRGSLGQVVPDVAGHVISYRYGGGMALGWQPYPINVNIVPMSTQANGLYNTQFEQRILDAMARGNTICARVRFEYENQEPYPSSMHN